MAQPVDRKRLYELHAQLCGVFTSPKRLEIINLLRDRELSVGEIARLAEIPQANLSQHLSVLRSRGIVKTRRDGVTIFYSLAHPKIVEAFDIVTEVLMERLGHAEKLSKEIREAGAK